MINGLIRPDAGRIVSWGRIGALIELGTGFNPILTGRENIYVNAAVLGLKRAEVDRRLDEIIDFAEIHEFIDAPVQSYSSGMKVRLGFSIAAHLNPDILLIDEILSVGDASFRERSYNRFTEFKEQGGTIIFVSHNSLVVESISDRVMMLERGRIAALGKPYEVVSSYQKRMLELSQQSHHKMREQYGDGGDGPPPLLDDDILITQVEFRGADGSARSEFEFGEPFEVRVHYQQLAELGDPFFVVGLQKSGHPTFSAMFSMTWEDLRLGDIPEHGVVGLKVRDHRLGPGAYNVHVGVQGAISRKLGKKWYTPMRERAWFSVLPGGFRRYVPGAAAQQIVSESPPVSAPHTWTLNDGVLADVDFSTMPPADGAGG